ncbi:MAG: DUF192 domain-containing protein [Burkholderiaceae bacterium]|nr:DUF192 domain-containing protein [Burkholderiaceae bacterium]
MRLTSAFRKGLFVLGAAALVQAFNSTALAATFSISVDNVPLIVEIAQTPEDQRRGLQHRSHLPDNHGMLFVFLNPRSVCMWMRDVPIDLDVGFFDEKMKLIKVSTMKRQTDTRHCSERPVAYALEVNRDWFKRHQIRPNAALKLD